MRMVRNSGKGAYVGVSEKECLYDVPRDLLKAIPGIELREMERIRDNSYLLWRRWRRNDWIR